MRKTTSILALAAIVWATAASAEEFKVGSVISLTGANARGGSGMHDGIRTAVEIFNARHPDRTIRLVTIDDESNPAKAISGVEQLAGEGVLAVTGGATSDLVAPALTAAEKAGLVYVTSGGTSEEFVAQPRKRFFRINNTAGYVKAMTGLFDDMHVRSLAILYSTKKSTSEMARSVEEIMTARGVKVTAYPFDAALNDFKPLIARLKSQDKPDVVNVLGYENDYVGILRAAKVLKPDVKAVVGVWQIANAKMATDFPALVENVYGTEILPWPVEFHGEEGKAFEEAFKRLAGHAPDYLNEYGYVQSMVLFEAILRAQAAGTLKTGGLADELRKTDVETLIGHLRFDERGDNPDFVQHIGQHQGGKIVIVWPAKVASGTMRFPGTPW